MFWKTLATVFVTVFIAEMGDKTQLATLLFSADRQVSKWAVFAGAALALTAAAGIGVLVGSQLERFVSPKALKTVAGIGFLAIGAWTLLSK
jgi:putative Ca2+/H+ antiporter (TMEM165/GDT1 family)